MPPASLHETHSPITGRFPVAGPGTDLRLSPAELREFEENGFLAGLDLLGPAEVEELRERLARIGDRIAELEPQLYEVESAWSERPEEVVLHFLGAWMVDELFHDLVFHPGATIPASQVLGVEKLRFWHDQVFWKPAGHPGVVPWHQDYAYWTRTGPPAHVTVFISLDDMGPENGGLEYVPGSHRWGLFPSQDFGGELDAMLDGLPPELGASFDPVPVRLRAGQASIHHSHLIHGSRANRSGSPRRAAVLNYFADGTRVTDDSAPLLRGVAHMTSGSVIEGPHFPLVLDRSGP